MTPLKCFDAKAFINVAEQLLCADDVLLALHVLTDCLPAYYIDHPVKEIEDLKNQIRQNIATSSFYSCSSGFELSVPDHVLKDMVQSLRGLLITQDVTNLNAIGLIPHIYDHAPGEGYVPVMLKAKELKFTYEQIYVNHPTYIGTRYRFSDVESKWDGIAPTIWLSTEVIEHLHREDEIRFDLNQKCYPHLPDVVHVSTPLYTYAPDVTDWRKIGMLGHLRTYSPKTFQAVVHKMFPEYSYAYYQSQVQHMRLWNPLSKFEIMKTNHQVDFK